VTTRLYLALHISFHGGSRKNFTWYSTSWMILSSKPHFPNLSRNILNSFSCSSESFCSYNHKARLKLSLVPAPTFLIQNVPLATEPGISLIILTQIKLLQRNLNRRIFVVLFKFRYNIFIVVRIINPLNPELNPICYLLALLGAHHFLHVSRIRVKLLTFRRLMPYTYGAPILDVSRSHTTTQHIR